MQALFLPGRSDADGQCFAVHFPPKDRPLGLIVHAHAFGDEMNKARRMVGLGARALCAQGYAVLLVDLHGCGDSGGTLETSSWVRWRNDLLSGLAFLRAEHGPAAQWLWGTRAGALLASEVSREVDPPCNLLLWQPQTSGKQALTQFLRLRLANQMKGDSAERSSTEFLMRCLGQGQTVDVAGYRFTSAVSENFSTATLLPLIGRTPERVVWLETTSRETLDLLPASAGAIEKWRSAGVMVETEVVQGPSFWQTLDIEDAPALISATVRTLRKLASERTV